MINPEFEEKVQEIIKTGKEYIISPRYLVNAFGGEKRTSGNTSIINSYLQEKAIETDPDYTNAWMDGEITLRQKEKIKSKRTSDPIQRIKLIPAANKEPCTVRKESTLVEATTLMRLNSYSQLPVISGQRSIYGYISWQTIGNGITNGISSDKVLPYASTDLCILSYETPLLEAIKTVIDKEFAVVQKEDKTISGIITLADVSNQFLSVTQPFILLEEIENHIRHVMDGKLLIDDIKKNCDPSDSNRNINHIDDLTFGEYVRIFENEQLWKSIGLNIDKTLFVKQLEKIRLIRNDVMHFEPDGITEMQLSELTNMAKFLKSLKRDD